MQGRKIQLARLDDRPVAAVHFDVGVAGVDHLRRNLFPAVRDLHRHDPPRRLTVVVTLEPDDAVLDRDEIALTEISRRPVIRLSEVVRGIELDEARAAVPQQRHREQPHLALKFLLDLRDHLRARRGAWGKIRPIVLRVGASRRSRGQQQIPVRASELAADLGADRVESRRVGFTIERFGILRVPGAEHEEQCSGDEECDEQKEASRDRDHVYPKFGS